MLAFALHTGVRLAEIGFLCLLAAGVWLVAAERGLGVARIRLLVVGVLVAAAGVLLIVATHWGHFGA
jgi:hypothetical protein